MKNRNYPLNMIELSTKNDFEKIKEILVSVGMLADMMHWANHFCAESARDGNMEQIRFFVESPELTEKAQPEASNFRIVAHALLNGHKEAVIYLTSIIKERRPQKLKALRKKIDSSMLTICAYGFTEIMEYLLMSGLATKKSFRFLDTSPFNDKNSVFFESGLEARRIIENLETHKSIESEINKTSSNRPIGQNQHKKQII